MNEQALKDKLRKAAKDQNLLFNELWHRLIMERFLIRLSRSNQADKFILKGGTLLARYIPIKRETKDLDFLVTKLQGEKEAIREALKSITEVSVNDGFTFHLESLEDLLHSHMKYPGFSAKLGCNFGKMKGKINIDIGLGDQVTPIEDSLRLLESKGIPVFEDSVSLLVYRPESIFSEKIQTAVLRGAVNSRMKDYHDILSLIRTPDILDLEVLSKQLKQTFIDRDTELKNLPITFTQEELSQLQRYWESYRRKNTDRELPAHINLVIVEINQWLKDYSVINSF